VIRVTCVAVVVDNFSMTFSYGPLLLSFSFYLPIYFHLSVYFRLSCHTTGGLVRKLQSASPANIPLMSVVGPSRHASA